MGRVNIGINIRKEMGCRDTDLFRRSQYQFSGSLKTAMELQRP
jgi:hypothetical protein